MTTRKPSTAKGAADRNTTCSAASGLTPRSSRALAVRLTRPTGSASMECMSGATLSRLVGRDAELARLLEAVTTARSGQPTLVLVEGEAGIGKTRLVTEAPQAGAGPDDILLVG